MRYGLEESTYLIAAFGNGDTVTIDMWRLSDDTQVVSGATCLEIGSTGVFKYSFSASDANEYYWKMSNGDYDIHGKIVFGGNTDYMIKLFKNKREIVKDGTSWKLRVYDDDNSTLLVDKLLYDKNGNNISDLQAGILAQELKSNV